MEIEVNCLPSDFGVNALESDYELNCEPSDFNVNAIGLYGGSASLDLYLFIVDEAANQIVDELGNFLVGGTEQSSQDYNVIIANCLPSNWNVNTE